MNHLYHTIIAPLLAVLALLCGLAGLTETASAAFNQAATEPLYGNFLLRESEVSTDWPPETAAPTRANGRWIYDGTLGVRVYVRQNPWTKFDPLGLWETDSYLGDVGQVFKGMGKAAAGLVTGVARSVADLPKNIAGVAEGLSDSSTLAALPQAVSEMGHDIASAAKEYGQKLESGDNETWGNATFQVLSIVTPIAATKATSAANVARASELATVSEEVVNSARATQAASKAEAVASGGIENGTAASAGPKPLLGKNPTLGKNGNRINTEHEGGTASAKSVFRNQTRGQKVSQHPLSPKGGVRRVAEDGTQIRMPNNGKGARIDLPGRGSTGHETIHFDSP